MRRLLSAVLVIASLVAICGCADKRAERESIETISVFYLCGEEIQKSGELIAKLDLPVSKETDELHAALTAITAKPDKDGYYSAFPPSVRISAYTLENGVLTVDLTQGYLNLSEVDKNIILACMVLTLCALDEVSQLNLNVDGITLEHGLTPDMIILQDSETNAFEQRITLYYPGPGDDFLYSEHRMLTTGYDKLLAEYVIDELLKGPQDSQLHSALPQGTQILSIEVSGDLCTVNLSREFYSNRPDIAALERMAVYSIVNSLCSISGIQSVKLLIDGEKMEKYVYIDISGSIRPEIYLSRELRFLSSDVIIPVYLATDTNELIAIPYIADASQYSLMEECAAYALVSGLEVCGYVSPVPKYTKIQSVYTENRVCTVEVSEEFIFPGAEPRLNLALQALVNTIVATGEADRVVVICSESNLTGIGGLALNLSHVIK